MANRFDEWNEVDCNECSHYWDSSCDAVDKGSKKPCNSFLATRSVVIPEEINWLRREVKGLSWCVNLLIISIAMHYLSHLFGW